jgi:mRNA interferase HigB
MQVIARRTLKQFWKRHPRAAIPLRNWYTLASVDFVHDNRIIFDIGGNKYRLVVHVAYDYGRVLVKFVGTHADYDRIDPETV